MIKEFEKPVFADHHEHARAPHLEEVVVGRVEPYAPEVREIYAGVEGNSLHEKLREDIMLIEKLYELGDEVDERPGKRRDEIEEPVVVAFLRAY
jgi:hypothetical protein